jgi:hypothetical protein
VQAETNMTCADAEIVSAVEVTIRQRTWGRIVNLSVESRCELVVVNGRTQTFYLEQMGPEAAREILGTARPFVIDVDVT